MSSHSKDTDRLHGKLKGVWRRHRSAIHIGGIAWALALLAPLVIALFFLDRMLDLPRLARWGLLLAAIAVFVWQLRKRWFTRLRPYDGLTWASRVETTFPQLNSLLVSFVQLSQPSPAATGSEELFSMVKNQALQESKPLDFSQSVDFRDLRPIIKWAVISVLVLLLVGFLMTSSLWVAGQRYLGIDIPYPTATELANIPSDQTIAEGSSISLQVDAQGKVPKSGAIWVRSEPSEQWRRIDVPQSDEPGVFRYEVASASESFEYRFEIGDASSHTKRAPGKITVVSPPKVVGETLLVTPPEYTGLQPYSADSLASTVPSGSALKWTVTLDSQVDEGEVQGPDDWSQAGTLSADGKTLEFDWTSHSAGMYRLQSTGGELGLTVSGDDYRLRLREDQEPRAYLVAPSSSVKATPNKNLNLTVRASDDYGLSEMAIVYRLNGEETEQRIPLGPPPSNDSQQELEHPRSGTWPLQWNIPEQLPNLKSGDLIEVALEVTEVAAHPDQARRAVTRSCEIEILSLTDYQAYITSRFDQLQSNIAEAERRETLIKHALDTSQNKTTSE